MFYTIKVINVVHMLNRQYSKVTSKGQITLPTNIRNKLNIPIGSRIELIPQDNCIIMVPINNSLSKLKNSLPKPKHSFTCEEMNDIIRSRS